MAGCVYCYKPDPNWCASALVNGEYSFKPELRMRGSIHPNIRPPRPSGRDVGSPPSSLSKKMMVMTIVDSPCFRCHPSSLTGTSSSPRPRTEHHAHVIATHATISHSHNNTPHVHGNTILIPLLFHYLHRITNIPRWLSPRPERHHHTNRNITTPTPAQ